MRIPPPVINHKPDIWFSPRNILIHYVLRQKEIGNLIQTEGSYKSVREAFSAALLLFGIMKLQEVEYWLQIVSESEQTPDIRTMYLEKNPAQPDSQYYQDIEVVTFGKHSSGSLANFILATKLGPKKAYPKDMIILCHIDKTTQVEPWAEVHNKLAISKVKNDVYLLGRVHAKQQIYQIAKVHPKIENLVTVDVIEAANQDGLTGVKRMVRSGKKFRDYHDGGREIPF